jgi:hypothetical protein
VHNGICRGIFAGGYLPGDICRDVIKTHIPSFGLSWMYCFGHFGLGYFTFNVDNLRTTVLIALTRRCFFITARYDRF